MSPTGSDRSTATDSAIWVGFRPPGHVEEGSPAGCAFLYGSSVGISAKIDGGPRQTTGSTSRTPGPLARIDEASMCGLGIGRRHNALRFAEVRSWLTAVD
jgi:hypothetical protein